MPSLEALLFGGFVGALPMWGYLIIGFLLTHILVMSVSLYLHRAQAHRSIVIRPWFAVFFRALFWLSQTSTVKEWVAVHRKHHRYVDKEDDPHSPKYHSIFLMLFATSYREAAKDQDTLNIHGKGTPEDWLENHLFTKHRYLGILVLALTFVTLFGLVPGAIFWLIQVSYMPIVASFGVNGIGHFWGYRNTDTKDDSRNVTPFDPIACGELLHNNHHADPNSAKFSQKWWEFDIGWGWIRIFEGLRLITGVRNPRQYDLFA